MSNGLDHIFEESECPDRATLLSYVFGTLSPAKEHLLEEHLIDCAFCSEAIEAYRAEKNLSEINEQLIEIDKRIAGGETKARRRGFLSGPHIYKYAALLALVLLSMTGLYFLLSDNKNQDIVMEAPVSRQAPTVQKQEDNRRAAPEPAKAVRMPNHLEKSESALLESDISTDFPSVESGDADIVRDKLEATSETQKQARELSKPTLSAATQKKEAALAEQKRLAKTKDLAKEDAARLANTSVADEVTFDDNALSAVKSTNESLATEQSSKKSRSELDRATDAYDNHFYIETINILLNFSGKDKRESAKADWYLASAYVQTREYTKARPILEKLDSLGGSYSRKARKLLESIQ